MDGTRFIVAGSFIDGTGAAVCKNVVLTVQDGIITTIGSAQDLTPNDKADIDDLSHCIIVPALVDCSVSLSQSPAVDAKEAVSSQEVAHGKQAAMIERHLHYCHTHGVMGVAVNNEPADVIAEYQKGGGQESVIDVRTSGCLYRSKQDLEDTSPAGDFLKIEYSGTIEDDEPPYNPLNKEDLCRILQRKQGRKSVVVANGVHHVKEAIEAGCDAIEQGYGMGEENIRKMAEKNILWIPSILRAKNGLDSAGSGGDVCCRFSTRYVAPGKPNPGAEALWKKMLAEQFKQLSFAKKMGVTTAVGTGAGGIGILHGESVVEEMKLFIKAGYSLEEAIQCGSENGARFFNMEKLGALTVGQQATFLITRGSVKQLPRKLSYLEGIYVAGEPCDLYSKNPVRTA